MRKSKWLSEGFIRVNGSLTWFNFVHFRHSHSDHHQYPVRRDLDLGVMLPIKVKPVAWLWAFTINFPSMKRVFSMHVRYAFGRERETILPSEWEKRIFLPEDEADLPYAPRGLLSTRREMLDALKKQRRDPDYYQMPEFPPTAWTSPSVPSIDRSPQRG